MSQQTNTEGVHQGSTLTTPTNAALVIEKGVPLPSPRGRPFGSASIMGTMRRMEVGDSLLLPGRKVTSLTSTIVQLRPLKYACRTVEGGVRVWRVA